MTTEWFRSWHGAPTDPKWLVIARKAGVVPGVVASVMWALLDHASRATDRGTVSDFDVETFSAFSGFEENDIAAVLKALEDKGVIVSGRFAQWERRQPKREDDSSERVRAHREREKAKKASLQHTETQCNAVKHNVTLDTDTEERREERVPNGGSGDPPPTDLTPPTEEERFWDKTLPAVQDRGVAKSMAMKLVHILGDFEEINRILEKTIKAKTPKRYLGGVLRGLAREAEAVQPKAPQAQAPTVPAWIAEARTAGQHVIRHENGRHWRSGGYVYDDLGEVVGW